MRRSWGWIVLGAALLGIAVAYVVLRVTGQGRAAKGVLADGVELVHRPKIEAATRDLEALKKVVKEDSVAVQEAQAVVDAAKKRLESHLVELDLEPDEIARRLAGRLG